MDSKEKAEVLTKAADISLGDILTMDYSWEGMDAMLSAIYYGKIREERLETWKSNTNPYDILVNNQGI